MKTLLFAALIVISLDSAAQGLRLNAYGNYQFQDQVVSFNNTPSYFDGQIKGGFQWGAGLEYMPNALTGIEISYFRQDATALVSTYKYPFSHNYDVAINYIFLSFNRYMRRPGSKMEVFGGGGAGVGIIDTKDPNPTNNNGVNSTSSTKFAWQFHGGGIYWASEKVGIKLQAQLQSAVQAVGGGVFFGTGGASAGVAAFSTMVQFGLGGGLVFKLGSKTAAHK
jgi:hypothetical protein